MEETDYILERTLSNGTERQLTVAGAAAYSEVESGLPGVRSVGEGIRSGSRTALPLVRSGAPRRSPLGATRIRRSFGFYSTPY
jgi:hypothetical protein